MEIKRGFYYGHKCDTFYIQFDDRTLCFDKDMVYGQDEAWFLTHPITKQEIEEEDMIFICE